MKISKKNVSRFNNGEMWMNKFSLIYFYSFKNSKSNFEFENNNHVFAVLMYFYLNQFNFVLVKCYLKILIRI